MVTEQLAPATEVNLEDPARGTEHIRRFLFSNRRNINPAVFRGKGIHGKFVRYDVAFAGFISDPPVARIGVEMSSLEGDIKRIELDHPGVVEPVNSNLESLRRQRQLAENDLSELKKRISGIGRNGFSPGDLSLAIGRYQTVLWSLKRDDKLSLPGQILAQVFKPLKVHPEIEEAEGVTHDYGVLMEAKNEEKKKLDDQFINDKVARGGELARCGEALFMMLDKWSLLSFDLLLVNLLYYQRFTTVEDYAKLNNLTGELRKSLLQDLAKYGVIPYDYYALMVDTKEKMNGDTAHLAGGLDEDQEYGKVDSRLPLRLRIGDQVFIDRELARIAFYESFGEGLSNVTIEQLFNRLAKYLTYTAEGHNPTGYKVFHKSDRRISLLGGGSRLQVGRYRIVINKVNMGNGGLVIDVANVVHRERAYHRK